MHWIVCESWPSVGSGCQAAFQVELEGAAIQLWLYIFCYFFLPLRSTTEAESANQKSKNENEITSLSVGQLCVEFRHINRVYEFMVFKIKRMQPSFDSRTPAYLSLVSQTRKEAQWDPSKTSIPTASF